MKIKLTEQSLNQIIRESISSVINEIGDTMNGHDTLGKLHARSERRGDIGKTNESKDEFEAAKYNNKWGVYGKKSRTFSDIGYGKKHAVRRAKELNDYCRQKDEEERLQNAVKESIHKVLQDVTDNNA